MPSSEPIRRLEEIFAHFPGIGPRQARRFVYYILSKSPAFAREFAQLVEEVRRASSECASCHRFFAERTNTKDASLCHICSDSSRERGTLMIVARDSDFETVEKSGAYRGLYFILGGTVPVLDKDPEKRIRLKTLLERIANVAPSTPTSSAPIAEIILSLNTTPEGEHTSTIVKDALKRLALPARITVLGRGLSTGAELEYADGETIRNALLGRK